MSFNELTHNFTHWLLQSGVQVSPKIEIRDLRAQSQGRGIIAIDSIEEDEIIFKIPRNVLLNIETGTLSTIGDNREKLLTNYTHWEGLILTILFELSLGENSKWFPYFKVLPDEFNCLMYWNDKELDYLKPSLVLDRIGKEKANDLYHKLIPNALIDLNIQNTCNNISIDLFHKIASTILSYSFDVERPDFDEDEEDDEVVKYDGYYKSMVCLADLLNADTHLSNANLFYEPEYLIMKAIKHINKNDQVYNTYGDHPNSEILRRYGYVEVTGSKFDFGEIPIDMIKQVINLHYKPLSIELINKIMDLISQTDVEEIETDLILDAYDFYIDGEMLPEFEILIQSIAIIGQLSEVEDLASYDNDSLIKFINRILKKCYQLIENGSMTINSLNLINLLILSRLESYPSHAFRDHDTDFSLNKVKMSEIVLKSEVCSLQKCLSHVNDKFKFINDDKLIRNIMKKRTNGDKENRVDVKRQRV